MDGTVLLQNGKVVEIYNWFNDNQLLDLNLTKEEEQNYRESTFCGSFIYPECYIDYPQWWYDKSDIVRQATKEDIALFQDRKLRSLLENPYYKRGIKRLTFIV